VHLSECLSNLSNLSNLSDVTERALRARADLGDRVEPIQTVRADVRRSFRPNHKLQPEETDRLVADYLAGMCLSELGLKYSLHRQTAKAHLERRGVTIRSEVPALAGHQVSEAVRLYAEGFGLNPIGTRLGVAPNTVKRALLAQGVELRPRGLAGPRPA
jgi:hypothetical protein